MKHDMGLSMAKTNRNPFESMRYESMYARDLNMHNLK